MCASCHVVTVKTELNNLQAIKNACLKMGWQFCQGQTTYKWVGTWVDDSPVPRLLFEDEAEYNRVVQMTREERRRYMPGVLGKCTHAIKIPGAEGEIGIIQRGNLYIPIWDYFAHGLIKLRDANGMAGFMQAYGVERTLLEAQRHGHTCFQHKLDDGSVQLRIQLGDI